MGLLDWWRKQRKHEDAAVIEETEEATTTETRAERAEVYEDRYDKGADEISARLIGEPSIEDVDRLGDEPGA
jgi:hypothetical protein